LFCMPIINIPKNFIKNLVTFKLKARSLQQCSFMY
jgi:hypothetical protein